MNLHFVRRIGHGGYGEVWLAEDLFLLHRSYAVKFFSKIQSSRAEAEAHLHASALARVDHPGVVKVISLEEQCHPETNENELALIMEYVEGTTLNNHRGPIDERLARAMIEDVVDALDAIHGAGLVHGDLHDGNVILTDTGAKLIDILYWRSLADVGTQTATRTRKEDVRDLAGIVRQLLERIDGVDGQRLSNAYYEASTNSETVANLRRAFSIVIPTLAAGSTPLRRLDASHASLPKDDDASSRTAERSLIAEDARFYIDFFLNFADDDSKPIVSIGLLPYVSTCVVESVKYLSDRAPGAAQKLQSDHSSVLRSSSARLRVLDDSRRDLHEVIAHLQWITDLHRRWFNETHTGFLAPLKKFIQDDLGLYTYEGRLICTSHVAFFNLGFDRNDVYEKLLTLDNMGPVIHAMSVDLGRYLAQLLADVGPNAADVRDSMPVRLPGKSILLKDVKSSSYYGALANRVALDSEAIAACIVLLLSRLNFADVILRNLAWPESSVVFKAKFVTAYHVQISLLKLQAYDRQNATLTSNGRQIIQTLLDDPELRWLREQKALRDILVHYRVEGVVPFSIVPRRPLFGLIEAVVPKQTFEHVDQLVDRCLRRIADALQEVVLP